MQILLIVYRSIAALVAVLVVVDLLRGRSAGQQATGAMVLVPLILRIFLVK